MQELHILGILRQTNFFSWPLEQLTMCTRCQTTSLQAWNTNVLRGVRIATGTLLPCTQVFIQEMPTSRVFIVATRTQGSTSPQAWKLDKVLGEY